MSFGVRDERRGEERRGGYGARVQVCSSQFSGEEACHSASAHTPVATPHVNDISPSPVVAGLAERDVNDVEVVFDGLAYRAARLDVKDHHLHVGGSIEYGDDVGADGDGSPTAGEERKQVYNRRDNMCVLVLMGCWGAETERVCVCVCVGITTSTTS